MRLWTYSEIKTKIEVDLDMQGEDFVTDDEMLGYVNDAIDKAEAVIHNLNEDYFLTSDTIPLVTDTSLYDMPANIYGNKIRHVHYDDGTSKYEVYRIRLKEIPGVDASDCYRYLIENDSASGPQMKTFPASRITSSTAMTRYYIRNANRLTADADVCDIPEFVMFVIAYAKYQSAIKDGHPRVDLFRQELADCRQLMVDTLLDMVPDENTDIKPDLSFYDDFV